MAQSNSLYAWMWAIWRQLMYWKIDVIDPLLYAAGKLWNSVSSMFELDEVDGTSYSSYKPVYLWNDASSTWNAVEGRPDCPCLVYDSNTNVFFSHTPGEDAKQSLSFSHNLSMMFLLDDASSPNTTMVEEYDVANVPKCESGTILVGKHLMAWYIVHVKGGATRTYNMETSKIEIVNDMCDIQTISAEDIVLFQ